MALDVVVKLGASLGGPMEEEDLVGPCVVLLWWLEDWLPPECPTPKDLCPRTGPETFAAASQSGGPGGPLGLECWEDPP